MAEGLIKLPISLGLKIHEELREKGIEPRVDERGLLSCKFTIDELSMIESLIFVNPTNGSLAGIDLLPNLKRLQIRSSHNNAYVAEKNLASISDNDLKFISKCLNLESLEIENQSQLTYMDVEKLKKLKHLCLTNNSMLEELYGLDSLTSLFEFECVGNESLSQLKDLDKVILKNSELCDLKLDLLLYPDAIGYDSENIFGKDEVLDKIQSLTVTWRETLVSSKYISINNNQMMNMHKKACNVLSEYVPQKNDKLLTVLGIELYLAENVVYDRRSLENKVGVHSDASVQIGNKRIGIASGPMGGPNGAFNAFMFNSCVCEGYTRAMQYLLKLKGIKSRNVSCISGKDKLHMSTDKGDNIYKTYDLPDDGYHSIISINDFDYLYDDPCWNAGLYQKGITSMPYVLLTKEEISETHTLSFDEKNIDNNTMRISRDKIYSGFEKILKYRKERSEQLQAGYDESHSSGDSSRRC